MMCRYRSFVGCAIFAQSLVACNPHVSLPPLPGPSAPAEQRIAAYEKTEVENIAMVITVGTSGGSNLEWTNVVLADGTKVYHPKDLAAQVAPDCITAIAADKAAYHGRNETLLSLAGVVTMLVSGVYMIANLSDNSANDSQSGFGGRGGQLLSAGGILAGIGGLGWGYAYESVEHDKWRLRAFRSFDTCLQKKLKLRKGLDGAVYDDR